MDQAAVLKSRTFPTAMVLPMTFPMTPGRGRHRPAPLRRGAGQAGHRLHQGRGLPHARAGQGAGRRRPGGRHQIRHRAPRPARGPLPAQAGRAGRPPLHRERHRRAARDHPPARLRPAGLHLGLGLRGAPGLDPHPGGLQAQGLGDGRPPARKVHPPRGSARRPLPHPGAARGGAPGRASPTPARCCRCCPTWTRTNTPRWRRRRRICSPPTGRWPRSRAMAPPRKRPEDLRSHRWFGVENLRAFGHRSRVAQMGYDRADYAGKPVIAIVNTWNDINPCHQHFRTRAEEIKRGIWQAGGFPIELPAISLSENFQKPSTMLYRNLLAMETEEQLRSYPIDGAVIMGGCDKTTPGAGHGRHQRQPAHRLLPGRPHVAGQLAGRGAGQRQRRLEVLGRAARRHHQPAGLEGDRGGHRPLGRHLHGHGHRLHDDRHHRDAGPDAARRLVDPGGRLQPRAHGHGGGAARGGDGVGGPQAPRHPHPQVVRERHHGVDGGGWLDQRPGAPHRHGRPGGRAAHASTTTTSSPGARPSSATCAPRASTSWRTSITRGACPRCWASSRRSCTCDERTISGHTLGENIAGARIYNKDVIRSVGEALSPEGGLAVLRGSLAPNGAVIKTSACEARLLTHTGPAVVFDDYNDLERRIDDEALPVTPDSVLVLRNAGPLGGPGLPRVGHVAHPQEAAQAGGAGHGPPLGRAHERHQLRHLRAARLARVLRGRAAGPAARRGPDRRSTSPTGASTCGSTPPSWPAAAPPGSRPSPATSAATGPCSPATSPRPTRAATSTSSKAPPPSASPRFTRGRPYLRRRPSASASASPYASPSPSPRRSESRKG